MCDAEELFWLFVPAIFIIVTGFFVGMYLGRTNYDRVGVSRATQVCTVEGESLGCLKRSAWSPSASKCSCEVNEKRITWGRRIEN